MTPYDRTIGLIHWVGKVMAESTISEVVATLTQLGPNVNAYYIKTSDGRDWQGKFDDIANKRDLAILGTDDVTRWVAGLNAADIDCHAWSVLHGKHPEAEADLVAAACNVPGLKSMLLDIEDGEGYFDGGRTTVRTIIKRIRDNIPEDFHLALNLDARGGHPAAIHIWEWLPHVQSLHPMVYHQVFSSGLQPETAVSNAFASLRQYDKPVVPMLQAYNDVPPAEMTRAAAAAFQQGAPGVTFFRAGAIGPDEFEAIRAINIPDELISPEEHFTCQDLINAFAEAARAAGQADDFWSWVQRANLEWLAHNRSSRYTGPPIADLPGLTAQEKSLVWFALTGQPLPGHDGTDEAEGPDGPDDSHDDVDGSGDSHDDDDSDLIMEDEVIGKFTNQKIINAFARAAVAVGEGDTFWEWVEAAELTWLAGRRREVYPGPAIPTLPGLTDEQKRLILLELRKMTPIGGYKRLEVPWVSQLGNTLPNDCGHACVLMLLHYANLALGVTLNQVYEYAAANDLQGASGTTSAGDLKALCTHYGLQITIETGFPQTDYFIEQINDDKPVIVLVDYASLHLPSHLASGPNQGAHWLVVVGYDNENYYVHDPLWLASQTGGHYAEGGRWHPVPKPRIDTAIDEMRSRICLYPS
jgi:uncharacterized protein YvpB